MRSVRPVIICLLCALTLLSPTFAQNVITLPPGSADPIPPGTSNAVSAPGVANALGVPGAPGVSPTGAPPAPGSFFGTPAASEATGLDYEADNVESVSADDSRFVLLGNVRVSYRGYVLNSDRADVDLDAGQALFSHNVVLHSPDGQTVRTTQYGTLFLDLLHGTYAVKGAVSILPPDTINAENNIGIILPVYVYGGEVDGSSNKITATATHFTTDVFEDRLGTHYSFGAREVYIIPGQRLVARDVSLFKKDHRFFTLPYVVVPLNQQLARQTLFPQVGDTPDEGLFIKFAVGYALTSQLPGILRLDLMQKKGVGTGFDQTYGSTSNLSKGSGRFTLYRLQDQQTGLQDITATLEHQQRFGTVNVDVNTQFEQNSYYAGDDKSQALNTQINLTRSVGNLSTSLLTNIAENNYGSGTTQNLTSSLTDTFSPTSREQLVTKFDYSQFLSPSISGISGTAQRELESNVDYTQHGKLFDFELLGTSYNAIGNSSEGTGFAGGLEQLPEFRLATDAVRLPELRDLLTPTTHLNLSLGDFNEPFSKTDTERASFNVDLGSTTKKIDTRNSFDYSGAFTQTFYGDDTAQYILNGHTGYHLAVGRQSSLGVQYLYLRPYGYTPFQFDETGYSNLGSLSYSYNETRQERLSLATGYDFNREHSENGIPGDPYQNVSLQSQFNPNSVVRLVTTSAYDLNHNTLLDLTNSLRVRTHNNTSLDLSGEYVPMQHTFSVINGDIDLPLLRDPNPEEDAGYRIRAIGGYNGYTHKFDYQGLALTRSFHDFEGTLVYQNTPNGIRPGSTITFNFRLKAFPAFEPFATGQYGQSLTGGIGEVY